MQVIKIDRLQPGMFISLAAFGWVRHPFLLNEFRISNSAQIQVLHEMGLQEVPWDPARSTAAPLPETTHEETAEMDYGDAALAGMQAEKRLRIEKVRQERERFARREREYEQSAANVSAILKSIPAKPVDAHAQAKSLVSNTVAGLLGAESVIVHLVSQKSREAGLAFHSLNVMMLSLLLGKALALSEEEMRNLGIGALLHDIGKLEIPPRILRSANRTPPEEEFYRAHIGYGIKAVAGVKDLAVPVKNIIACHHEFWDGSGFPNRLQAEKIPRLARIAAIANRYDDLCNPFDISAAKTPAEAVTYLFKKEGMRFEPELIGRFVKVLGVYPPGSFIRLANGSIGLVMETDPDDLLHPLVMLYDQDIPRSEALLLNLGSAGLDIEAVINPANLPLEVVEYLAPRGRVDYYVEGKN
jgi:HD-GYP domain-containing protein (c-di-GMP phosphodiesterase class II)